MMTRSSVAQYIVDTVDTDRANVVRRTAAWLVASGRKREVTHLMQDVARLMQARGRVWVVVTAAHTINPATRTNIETFVRKATGAQEVYLDIRVDESCIGGVRIETPLGSLDTSVRAQLTDFVQGVKV